MKKIICLLLALFMCFPVMEADVHAAESLIIDVTDYGADPSGMNDSTEAIWQALEAAKELGKDGAHVTVNFPEGEYHIYKDTAQQREYHTSNTNSIQNPTKYIGILIENQENLTIEGNGSLFMMHGNMMALAVAYSKNITLNNFSWDFEVPTVTEMTVTNVTDTYTDYYIPSCFPYEVSGKSIIWSSDISPYTNEPYWTGTNHDVDGHGTYAVVGYHPDDEMSRNYYPSDGPLNNISKIEQLGDNEVRVYYTSRSSAQKQNQQEGVIFELCSNAHRQTAGAFTYESENVLAQKVNVHFMHGFGWLIQMSKDVYYKECNFLPREGSGHVTVSFADGIHASGAAGEIVIEDCNFANTHDDPINLHGTFTRVQSLDAQNNTLTLKYIHTQQGGFPQYHVGDEVQFFTRDTLESSDNEAVYTVKSIIQDTDESSDLRTMIVEFEEELPSFLNDTVSGQPKYVAENITYAPEVTITGCTFRNVPTRGILCTTRNKVLIENNIFYNMSMATIFLSNDSDEWYESGPIRDMTIRGNTFYIKDIGRTAWTYASAIYVHPVTKGGGLPDASNPIHKNITIEENTFYMDLDTVVKAESVENLVFRNNKVYRLNPDVEISIETLKNTISANETISLTTNATGNTNNGTIDNVFNFTKCKDVFIEGNTYDDGLKLYAVCDQATINNCLIVNDKDITIVNNESQAVSEPVRDIKYASMNPDIVSVDDKGNITGLKAGTAKVFAYYEWNDTIIQSNTVEITVTGTAVQSEDITIAYNGKEVTDCIEVNLEDTQQLQFTELNNKEVEWSVLDFETMTATDNASIKDGKAVFASEGVYWVQATSGDITVRVPVVAYGEGDYGLNPSFSITREDSANYTVSKDSISITAQSGNDLWQWDNNLENLFLYTPDNSDNLRAIVKVDNLPVRESNKWDTVSFLLYQGDDDYYTIGKKSHYDGFATVKERAQTATEVGGNSTYNNTTSAYLGISKSGSKITLDYSIDGTTWTEAISYTDTTLTDVKLGFGTWGTTRTAVFSEFKVGSADLSYAELMNTDSITITKDINDRPEVENTQLNVTQSSVEVTYDFSDTDGEGETKVLWTYEQNGKTVNTVTTSTTLSVAGVDSITAQVYPVDIYGTPGTPSEKVTATLNSENTNELYSVSVNGNTVISRNAGFNADVVIPDTLDKVELSWISVNDAVGSVKVYKNDELIEGTYKNSDSVVVDVEDQDVLSIVKEEYTYYVMVHCRGNNNTELEKIKIDKFVLDITGDTSYHVDTKVISNEGTMSITTKEEVSDVLVTYGHDRKEVEVSNDGNTYSIDYKLISGLNLFYFDVIAEDGRTHTQYIISTIYIPEVDLSVDTISINNEELHDFNSNTYNYSYELKQGDDIEVTVDTSKDNNVIMTLNNEVKTGTTVSYKDLKDGINVLKVKVQSNEDSSKTIYTIEILKPYNTNTTLTEVTVNDVLVNVEENKTVLHYVSEDTVTINVVPQDSRAQVQLYLGNKPISNETTLYKDANDVKIVVTAADGMTKSIYTIDFEKAIYLSDIEWTKDVKGYFDNWRDASGDYGTQTIALKIDGTVVTFAKGVGAHANSTIEVDLTNKGYKQFVSYVGINANQTQGGDVIFNVYTDGTIVNTAHQTYTDNASYFEVDLTGKTTLTLNANTNGSDACDHATWGDAKFIGEFTQVNPDTTVYPETVTLDKDAVALKNGETVTLTATVKPANADTSVVWTSSDETVATVVNGKVTAKNAGTAIITASAVNGMSASCVVTVEKPFPFTDVYDYDWYKDYVNQAYQLGLMTGASETLFKPKVSMNRGMVAIVLHRMEGAEAVEFDTLFPDVKAGEYYAESVVWAKLKGVINGYGDGTFRPLRLVTREEMAQMIYNFAKYKGVDVRADVDLSTFLDGNKVSSWHKDAMMWANANGLITGKYNGTKLDPQGTATRAECCKMLVEAYKTIYK